jgi:hypothetical protein
MTIRSRFLIIVLCSALSTMSSLPTGIADSIPLTCEQAPSSSEVVPMTVLWSQVNPERKTVTFALQNTGTKAITAWDVTITAGTEPEAKHGGHGADAFREFAGIVEGRSFILSNGSITATAQLPRNSENLLPIVVKPAAAVFADNTSAGDPRFINLVFERRLAQLEAWQEISQHLENARKAGALDAAVLGQIQANVDTAIAQKGQDVVRSTFRTNLALAIANVRAGKAQVPSTLERLLAEAHRTIAVATAHSKR